MFIPFSRPLRNAAFVAAVFCLSAIAARAQAPSDLAQPRRREVRATRTATPPVLDGRLSDETWKLTPPATSFTQRDPDEGRPPTQRTEVRFLYDDHALYVGARMFDAEPARITRRMSTRDDAPDADVFSLYLDPLHDRFTGVIFRVSAATGEGVDALLEAVWRQVAASRERTAAPRSTP